MGEEIRKEFLLFHRGHECDFPHWCCGLGIPGWILVCNSQDRERSFSVLKQTCVACPLQLGHRLAMTWRKPAATLHWPIRTRGAANFGTFFSVLAAFPSKLPGTLQYLLRFRHSKTRTPFIKMQYSLTIAQSHYALNVQREPTRARPTNNTPLQKRSHEETIHLPPDRAHYHQLPRKVG